MNAATATKILAECIAETASVTPDRASGCGRIYVVPTKENRRAFKAAVAANGRRWIKRAYGVGVDCMYVGYDNATGREMAQGKALADALTARGIKCFMDAVGD